MAAPRRPATATETAIRVVLEIGARKVFASAVDWPGWSRAAEGEVRALERLADYAPRFAAAAAEAGLALPDVPGATFDVVERLEGSATTDFGAPGQIASCELDPLDAAAADRLARLVRASWTVLDRVVEVSPPTLRKGPRGGGRDRDEVIDHVVAAETAYAGKIGVRVRRPEPGDGAAAAGRRVLIEDALRSARAGEPSLPKGWPPRYAARRIAWHVLDHAWEIEDKRVP